MRKVPSASPLSQAQKGTTTKRLPWQQKVWQAQQMPTLQDRNNQIKKK
jgi:hypothetical protein